jgi:hypothetical protein
MAEGGAKFVWVFRVKNHDFTPKHHIFSNFKLGGIMGVGGGGGGGGGGGARRVRPPPGSAPAYGNISG